MHSNNERFLAQSSNVTNASSFLSFIMAFRFCKEGFGMFRTTKPPVGSRTTEIKKGSVIYLTVCFTKKKIPGFTLTYSVKRMHCERYAKSW